ncbi:Flagellar motor rotation protein MotA [hydrothermal vent metagenome]|uniref:Flagellar motor rotation protein MotA n=1 Tax=hydrothermal vent metagenome TaxID=652676 RepID=A0A3B1CTV2_9ZZZZ
MEKASLIGIMLGASALVGGTLLEGGSITFILQPAAALIVFGGTLGATLLSFTLQDVLFALGSLKDVFFKNEAPAYEACINQIVSLAHLSRKKGLVAIEPHLVEINDPFFRKTLSLAIDGISPGLLRETLEEENITFEDTRLRQSRVFETAGGFAPTIGIIGAVIGLIQVMQNLSDPAKLGQGIAVAFVATVYGVGVANLLLLPISKKLKNNLMKEIKFRAMIVEAVVGIQSGINPHYLRDKLLAFIER